MGDAEGIFGWIKPDDAEDLHSLLEVVMLR
jgi:hypothetical protein